MQNGLNELRRVPKRSQAKGIFRTDSFNRSPSYRRTQKKSPQISVPTGLISVEHSANAESHTRFQKNSQQGNGHT